VWNRALAGTRAIDYAFGTVRRKADFLELPIYDEWVGKFGNYRRQYAAMEYLLVRGSHLWSGTVLQVLVHSPSSARLESGAFSVDHGLTNEVMAPARGTTSPR
jgi:hypothetical protein